MDGEAMTPEGYPDEQELERIKTWPINDAKGLFAFVEKIWTYGNYLSEPDDGYWEISTGGWSGNEDIIEAMQANLGFWSLNWLESRRGGHYKFKLYGVK